MSLEGLGEFGLLESLGVFRATLPPGWVGPGDDTAVIPRGAGATLFTTDCLVEGVHFRRSTTGAADLGYRAVAVNVSDVAAMGGRPLAFTVSLALPRETPEDWVRDLHAGMREAGEQFGCPLVGGDTVSGPLVFLSVALLGESPAGGPLLRSGARAGDDLFVTGTLGDSAAGLLLLESGAADAGAFAPTLVARHRRPSPRLALAGRLADGLATAMIDVSDGLLQDLSHLLAASAVGATLWREQLPLSGALQAAAPALERDPAELALGGGEDYELLFTAPPGRRTAVFQAAAREASPLARIGTVEAAPGTRLTAGGEPVPLPARGGFDHFRR